MQLNFKKIAVSKFGDYRPRPVGKSGYNHHSESGSFKGQIMEGEKNPLSFLKVPDRALFLGASHTMFNDGNDSIERERKG